MVSVCSYGGRQAGGSFLCGRPKTEDKTNHDLPPLKKNKQASKFASRRIRFSYLPPSSRRRCRRRLTIPSRYRSTATTSPPCVWIHASLSSKTNPELTYVPGETPPETVTVSQEADLEATGWGGAWTCAARVIDFRSGSRVCSWSRSSKESLF